MYCSQLNLSIFESILAKYLTFSQGIGAGGGEEGRAVEDAGAAAGAVGESGESVGRSYQGTRMLPQLPTELVPGPFLTRCQCTFGATLCQSDGIVLLVVVT